MLVTHKPKWPIVLCTKHKRPVKIYKITIRMTFESVPYLEAKYMVFNCF